MGIHFLDQYTYLHFAVGIIVYFWNISLLNLFILHVIFEMLENTQMGIYVINKLLFWPGGKSKPDTIINSIGDTTGSLIGWISAYYLDNLGNKYGWYNIDVK